MAQGTDQDGATPAGQGEGCKCDGRCKHLHSTETPPFNQFRFSPETRAELQFLADLELTNDADLTTASAKSAARHLLRNY
jgi:hypothetical protein